MSLDALIMALGAFVLILPELGLPTSWKTVLFTVAGACIIGLGIAVRRRGGASRTSTSKRSQGYEESAPRSPSITSSPHLSDDHERT